MNFTQLVEKAIAKYPVSITLNYSPNNSYGYFSITAFLPLPNEQYKEEMLERLSTHLELPISKKDFNFTFGFKSERFSKKVLLDFIKQKPSMEDFDNVFHTFFKNVPVEELFTILSEFEKKQKGFELAPYFLHLLKQDFSRQSPKEDYTGSEPFSILKIITLIPKIFEDRKNELNESLYSFLHTHKKLIAPTLFLNSLASNNFQARLFDALMKINGANEPSYFNEFLTGITIKKKNTPMIEIIENCSVFNLSFSHLAKTYKEVSNKILANRGATILEGAINMNCSEYLTINSVNHYDPDRSEACFVATFHKNLTVDNLPDIFDTILSNAIHFKQLNILEAKPVDKDNYQVFLESIPAYLDTISLSNLLVKADPSPKVVRTGNKI